MGPEKLMPRDEALSLEELERQSLELLPDRLEMSLVNVNGNHAHANGILNGSFHFNHTVNSVDL